MRQARLAVIVLGMHRSGTSAAAGAAVRLGLAPPLDPLPAAADNPAGFCESRGIVGLNHTILQALGCAWHDCLAFDPARITDRAWADAFDLSLRFLRGAFAEAPAFVVKDPRLCLTLPAWLPGLRALGAAVSVLLVVRHPREVVRSLLRRDHLPEEVTAPLWLHHMLEAERLSRPLPRAVVHYDDLLRDWRTVLAPAGRRAGIAWPLWREGAGPDIGAFLDPSLRHHDDIATSAALGPSPARDLLAEAWTVFQTARGGVLTPEAEARLDRVREDFAAWRTQPAEVHFSDARPSGLSSNEEAWPPRQAPFPLPPHVTLVGGGPMRA